MRIHWFHSFFIFIWMRERKREKPSLDITPPPPQSIFPAYKSTNAACCRNYFKRNSSEEKSWWRRWWLQMSQCNILWNLAFWVFHLSSHFFHFFSRCNHSQTDCKCLPLLKQKTPSKILSVYKVIFATGTSGPTALQINIEQPPPFNWIQCNNLPPKFVQMATTWNAFRESLSAVERSPPWPRSSMPAFMGMLDMQDRHIFSPSLNVLYLSARYSICLHLLEI